MITVLIAFGANLLVAIGKTIAAVLTGSASMVAESAHSWADTGNEIFLLIAERRSARKPDARHPLGYGKDAYIWSMFAAFGLFTAGAVVSIQHGIQELIDPEPADNFAIAYIVLAGAFVLEGVSFMQAFRQTKSSARQRGRSLLGQVLQGSNPTVRAVFFEDAAALAGLLIAFIGVLAHQLTGSPVFDAIGSIAVGLLLGVVAIVLIDRNRQFLLGQAIDEPTRELVLQRLKDRPEIDRVTYLHLEFLGPERLFLVAAIDLVGNAAEDDVALTLRWLERELEGHEFLGEVVMTLSAKDEPSL
ncbi:cation diffusion facilitator family transporter [Glaciihabitans arcticus]|uniref:Cation diffusion facilitator family transporter n=1 Tax=Glaciihabitans arcticus TaxID=2668039 RepID=A0A4Q9GWC7_9MICO|nr:cation diffusion facilitator family transporter [Glaciihabitans arcticus]TBN57898.1 cation diffusion facilitator family transporter [Glaciihabitans arcticus]